MPSCSASAGPLRDRSAEPRPIFEFEFMFKVSMLIAMTDPDNLPGADTAGTKLSARGARTRQRLVQGAREVFERDGYLDARIVDIAAAAGIATGSFYTYFTGKAEAFAAVMAEVQEEMLHAGISDITDQTGIRQRIAATNRAYLRAYRRNAKLMALIEQVATIDDDFFRLRRQRADAFAERNARAITRLQTAGQADATLDPLITAHAINAMVSRTAYLSFVGGANIPFETLVHTLTTLWCNALDIPDS